MATAFDEIAACVVVGALCAAPSACGRVDGPSPGADGGVQAEAGSGGSEEVAGGAGGEESGGRANAGEHSGGAGEAKSGGASEEGGVGGETMGGEVGSGGAVTVLPSGRISGSLDHTCAVRDGGTVACWGDNGAGQLGDGTKLDRHELVLVKGLPRAVAVAAGQMHTCALRQDGTVWCWGGGDLGQLGNGTREGSLSPKAVPGLTNAVAIAAGPWHACAVRDDGSVACWGYNYYGQLGDGTKVDGPGVALRVMGLTDAVAIAAGGGHSCAVNRDGSVACWGLQALLGQDGGPDSSTPVAVTGLTDAAAIAAGDTHTCALRRGGKVACWGSNGYGNLGDGTTMRPDEPVAVLGLEDAVSIAAGWESSCAVKSDGMLACWGRDHTGPVGDGATQWRLNLLATWVPEVTGAVSVTTGWAHTCAVLQDGSGTCWGWNLDGQLGNGTTTDSAVPVAVSGLGVE